MIRSRFLREPALFYLRAAEEKCYNLLYRKQIMIREQKRIYYDLDRRQELYYFTGAGGL